MQRPLLVLLALAPAAAALTISDPGQGIFNYTAANAPGLSGITYIGGNTFHAVNDSAAPPRVFPLTIGIESNGTISSASIGTPTALAAGHDHEDVAFHPGRGTIFVSDEGDHPDGGYIREFAFPSGTLAGTVALPPVLLRDRQNLGLEALSFGAGFLWTANEEALEHESAPATASGGSTVRLQRFDAAFGIAGQWAYETDPASSASGASGLLALPDGNLLVLERATGFTSPSSFRNRIYLVDFSGATDVSGIADLDDTPFAPVTKTLLWERNMGSTATHNFEGITLGPQLGEESFSIILIADNGTGSQQHLYPLLIHGIPEPGTVAGVASALTLLFARRVRRRSH